MFLLWFSFSFLGFLLAQFYHSLFYFLLKRRLLYYLKFSLWSITICRILLIISSYFLFMFFLAKVLKFLIKFIHVFWQLSLVIFLEKQIILLSFKWVSQLTIWVIGALDIKSFTSVASLGWNIYDINLIILINLFWREFL